HLALARREHLRDHADTFRRNVDHQHLHRLEDLTAGLLGDDGRLRDLHLVAFAAHGLDNHRQLQFAAAHHAPGVGRQLLDAGAHIAPRFEFDSFAQLPRGDKISFAARPWRIVHREGHRHGRLVDANRRQRTRVLEVGDRFTDRDVLDARHDHYLARTGGFSFDAREPLPSVDVGDLADQRLAVAPAKRIVLRRRHRAGDDSADREAADVIVVVDIIDLELQRRFRIDFGTGQVRDDRVEQRDQVFARDVEPERCGAGARLRIEHWKIELAFARAEVDEEIVHLVENLGCTRVGAIDLVDADYRGQVRLERLLEHETRLRQRSLARIDQQQHAVHHRQSAFDLAAEVRVARSIDDVDARFTPPDRGVLRHDRDATFALERVGIHHAIDQLLVGAENARLPQHRIDQSGFTVIDMSDDCYISYVWTSHFAPDAKARPSLTGSPAREFYSSCRQAQSKRRRSPDRRNIAVTRALRRVETLWLVALELLEQLLDVFDFGDAPIAVLTARHVDFPLLPLVVLEVGERGVAVSMQDHDRGRHGRAGHLYLARTVIDFLDRPRPRYLRHRLGQKIDRRVTDHRA